MDQITLGKTGLKVSAMGLGCGGHSRLGMSQGKSEAEASLIVKRALELGVNFIDTAEAYGTEGAVGLGIQGVPRDRVVLSTKAGVHWEKRRCTAPEMRRRVEACLTRLGTEFIDVFHLHGVRLDDYPYACEELVPGLLELRSEGKIRFVGITEAFAPDPSHEMLRRAVEDDCWDVMMVGFNIVNQSARESVLPVTKAKAIGTLCMFAVRRVLSQPEGLRDLMKQLIADGLVSEVDADTALDFVLHDSDASSLQDAAYRFCRWEPGLDVVLSGTGNLLHLETNAKSLSRPALPVDVVQKLRDIFSGVDSVSGN